MAKSPVVIAVEKSFIKAGIEDVVVSNYTSRPGGYTELRLDSETLFRMDPDVTRKILNFATKDVIGVYPKAVIASGVGGKNKVTRLGVMVHLSN